MITEKELGELIHYLEACPGYRVEGSLESGKIMVRYMRPNGLEFGTGNRDYTQFWEKQSRKWKAFRG